jgi:hypothetical protein
MNANILMFMIAEEDSLEKSRLQARWPKLHKFLQRKTAQYGNRFDPSELFATDATIFDAYESGARMNFNYSPTGLPEDFPAKGYVGITTGWKPAFIRIRDRRSHGGSDILTNYRAMGYSNTRNPKFKD